MTGSPWWTTWEGLLDYEVEQLSQLGIPAAVDKEWLERRKVARVDFSITIEGAEHNFYAVYPDTYPWFRPEVFAPGHSFAKHQNPFGKNLCLLDRPADSWDPATDSLASLVRTQLGKVVDAQVPAPELEVHQAEPVSFFFQYDLAGGFIVDSTWTMDAQGGTFDFVVTSTDVCDGRATFLNAVILEVRDSDGDVMCTADDVVANLGDLPRLEGRWHRVSTTGGPRATHVLEAVTKRSRGLRHDHSQAVAGGRLDVVAAIIDEEVTYGGGTSPAWLVTVASGPTGRHGWRQRSAQGVPVGGRIQLARGLRAGPSDLAARVPELGPLRTKKVVVFGAGGVGAPTVLELAKAGFGTIFLIDHDYLDPATAVRYPLGVAYAGWLKVAALRSHIREHYPHVRVEILPLRVGQVRLDGRGDSELEGIAAGLHGADLVYDAVGDIGISYFLNDLARRHRLPYIVASGSVGGWGGRVAVFLPTAGPCYECLIRHIGDTPEDEPSPLTPPADPHGALRPTGCADETFTAAGFDVTAVAVAGARLVAATVCGGATGGYPPVDWNVGVMRLRDGDGRPTCGTAEHYQMERHPDCDSCQRHAA